MLYAILFTLAIFLNLALALVFGATGAFGLGFVAIFMAFASMAAAILAMFKFQ